MGKLNWKAGTMVYPVPAALVSAGATPDEWNLLTVAWIGTICTNPAMLSISVRPERHTFPLIMRNMEFTVNLTTVGMAEATDWCGVRSGAEFNKWKETGLVPIPGVKVKSPTVEQSPLSIECRVKTSMDLGSHTMIIGEVLNVRADERFLDPESGRFMMEKANLLAYVHGHYYALGEMIGKFGFSVEGNKKKKF